VHYERAIKGGLDAHGREITHWSLWIAKALKREWRFDEPEYLAWLERQASRFAPALSAARPAPRVSAAPDAVSAAAAAPPPAIELPTDDVWGLTIQEIRDEIGEVQLRTWFASSWLDELGEDTVRVGTSNAFAADWIRSRWGARLEELLSIRVGRPVRLVIVHQSAGPALP
jgi:hypothetical protein